jgi:hypothetical protein
MSNSATHVTEGRRPPLVSSLAVLFVLAAALGGYFLIAPALRSGPYYAPVPNRVSNGYSRQVLALFVPYALALWAWGRGRRTSVWALLAGAAALHLLVLFAPLPQSQDLYQYLFYGRMQAAHGANPYVVQPSAFYLDPWYSMIRWPNQTSVYGPVWTLLSAGVAKAAGSSLMLGVVYMKLAVLALDLIVIGSILSLARTTSDPEGVAGWGLLVYAWNPLVLISVPLGGHADVAVAAAFLGAFVLRRGRRHWAATIVLAAAALVKSYAVVPLLLHVLLLARDRGGKLALRHAATGAGLAVLSFAPYWAGWRTFRALFGALTNLANNSLTGTVQFLVERLLSALGDAGAAGHAALVRWPAFALVVVAVVWAAGRVKDEESLWRGTLVVLAVYVALSPWFSSWYLVAPLALVAVLPRDRLTVPLLTFSGTALVSLPYGPWSVVRVVQTALRYGPPLAVFARQPRPGSNETARLACPGEQVPGGLQRTPLP